MLCLSRKAGQMILIGEPPNEIRLLVVSARGNRVRLGLVAPRDTVIRRAEVPPEQAVKWQAPGQGDPRKEAGNG